MELETYSFISLVIQAVPALLVVYVSLRLSTFENRFLEKLDGRYVNKELYNRDFKSNNNEHKALWERIKEAIKDAT